MRQAPDEADLWARAQAALDSTPPEPGDRQAARERYDRRLARAFLVGTGTAVALAFLALLLDPRGDRPTWRLVTAVTVVVLAVLFLTTGPLHRPSGSIRELTRPLEWLSGPSAGSSGGRSAAVPRSRRDSRWNGSRPGR